MVRVARVTVTLPDDLAGQGFEDWARGLPDEETAALVDRRAGKAVRWLPSEGWVEGRG